MKEGWWKDGEGRMGGGGGGDKEGKRKKIKK